MKLLVIFNPKAAHGRSAERLDEARRSFEQHDLNAHIEPTEYPGHATELVRSADLSGFDGVIAVGGDGTLFEVINGLFAHQESARVPLGLLPMGTGNAFSRELDVDMGDHAAAIAIIKRGRVRRIDVARVRTADADFHFVNIMHLGFAVDAGRSAQKIKFLGNSAYTLATLWQVMRVRSYPLTIEIDGETRTMDNVFTSIANTRYTGTHFLIAPDAEIDDGKLDLIMLGKITRRRLLKLFPTIYDGRHTAYEEVSCVKARNIRLISPSGMLLGPDGEFLGHTPAEISCLEKGLSVFF